MKTLIFFGSPRKKGDTEALLSSLLSQLPGEKWVVDAYRADIRPCVDCRACREKPGCVIRDDMQKVYDFIPDCDNVVIASPLYFSEVTPPLLSVFSRLQCMYSARRFRGEKIPVKPKKGVIILTGGGNGGPDKALDTCRGIFRHYLNAAEVCPPIMSLKTDDLPAREDEAAICAARACGKMLAGTGNSPCLGNTDDKY